MDGGAPVHFYPNLMGRVIFFALQKIVESNRLNVVFNYDYGQLDSDELTDV